MVYKKKVIEKKTSEKKIFVPVCFISSKTDDNQFIQNGIEE